MANARTTSPRRRGATQSAAPMRLPSTRERRPAMAALAVLLIVGGALASGWLALRAGDRADYLMITTEKGQGERIEEGDLTTISLPRDMDDRVIAAESLDTLVGQYATTQMLPGTILLDSMVDPNTRVQEDLALFDLYVDAGGEVANSPKGSYVLMAVGPDDQVNSRGTVFGEVIGVSESDQDSSIGGGSGQVLMSVAVAETCFPDLANAKNSGELQVSSVSVDAAPGTGPCGDPWPAQQAGGE